MDASEVGVAPSTQSDGKFTETTSSRAIRQQAPLTYLTRTKTVSGFVAKTDGMGQRCPLMRRA